MPTKHWIRDHPFLSALLWAFIPSLVAVIIAPGVSDSEIRKLLYGGAATLFFGGFFGGMLKLLLDDVVAAKRRRDDAAGFVTNVLGDLKSAYDRVARARILVPAERSVKTYSEEMRGLIEARVKLRNVVRALEGRAEGLDKPVQDEIKGHVTAMADYLKTLTTEFRDNYKPLSDKQRGYEARAESLVKAFAESRSDGEPPKLPEFVWDEIEKLDHLADFIKGGTSYEKNFGERLDQASGLLRRELARILG